MKNYVVTETAPEWVAGQRVKPGDVLTLTEEQAAYELARNLIRPAPAAVAAAQQTKKPRGRRRGD